MIIEDFRRDMSEFEGTLQKMATEMTSGTVSERLPPAEIWNRFEGSVTSLQNLAKKIQHAMLVLNPERAPVIEERFKALSTSLNACKEVLLQKTESPASDARRALEQLRKLVTEGSDYLGLARNVEDHPSEVISEILKLREVYGAKDYLSTVFVPESVHARLTLLREQLESLRLHMLNLEKAFEEIRTHMDIVEEEIKKFVPPEATTTQVSGETQGQGEDKPALNP